MGRLNRRMLIAALLVGPLSGCSYLNSQNDNLNAPEYELSKTGVGVATGAVIGAGLGAIIGSATGDAGPGLAIGALAGAATGGVVGNELQERDKNIAALRQDVSRANEETRAQKVRIDKLSEELVEKIERDNRPSLGYGETSFEDYQGSGRARPLGTTSIEPPAPTYQAPRATFDSQQFEYPKSSRELYPNRAGNRSAKALADDTPTQVPSYLPKATVSTGGVKDYQPPVAKYVPPPALPAQKPIIKNEAATLPPARKKVQETEDETLDDLMAYDYKQSQLEGVSEERGAGGAIVSIREKSKRDYASSPRCVDAESEAKRAQNATSDADRLYYLSRALKLCPESSEFHLRAGRVYERIGRVEDAEIEYRQAIDLDPDNSDAQRALDKLT